MAWALCYLFLDKRRCFLDKQGAKTYMSKTGEFLSNKFYKSVYNKEFAGIIILILISYFMKLLAIPFMFYCLPFIVSNVQSQNKFFVKGAIDGIANGEQLGLYRYRDGSIDEASMDTVHNGKFTLTDTASQPTLYWVLSQGDHFPNMALEIWAAPGITINVTGKGYLFKTWKVKSDLREQLEENQFLAASAGDWDKIQAMQIQQKRIHKELKNAVGNKKDSLEQRSDLLDEQTDAINKNIDRKQIGLLQKLPVTDVWLNKMANLARGVSLNPKAPYRDLMLNLYKKLNSEQRQSDIGEKITANLFPLPTVKPGELMIDMLLSDTQMVKHELAEYKEKNKYLLLDFGFVNCGPCIMAIPETKLLSESLKDKLTIVAINVDETAYWVKSAATKQISWINLNDNKGRDGLAARYGAEGYPYYVMISPEGIVSGVWTGYEKGHLTKKIKEYIH